MCKASRPSTIKGLFYTGSSEASYDKNTHQTSPKFSGAASNRFSLGDGIDNFGVAAALSWQKRDFGSDKRRNRRRLGLHRRRPAQRVRTARLRHQPRACRRWPELRLQARRPQQLLPAHPLQPLHRHRNPQLHQHRVCRPPGPGPTGRCRGQAQAEKP